MPSQILIILPNWLRIFFRNNLVQNDFIESVNLHKLILSFYFISNLTNNIYATKLLFLLVSFFYHFTIYKAIYTIIFINALI